MEFVIKRIKEHLAEGDYYNALRRCIPVLMSRHSESLTDEDKKYREEVIELVHGSGLFEELLAKEEAELKKGETNFGMLYELYKFEASAFKKVSLRTTECMTFFYENRDDRMAAIGWSETLLERYIEEGRDEMVDSAQKRVDANIELLRERAANYQKTGEHRYAFNSYRCLLECDFESYEYHLGYIVNAIKSGKPNEAYNTILEDKAHRDYILRDEALKNYFYDLSHVVAADEEKPELLQ